MLVDFSPKAKDLGHLRHIHKHTHTKNGITTRTKARECVFVSVIAKKDVLNRNKGFM